MGWFNRIFGIGKEQEPRQRDREVETPGLVPPYFAVIDVETTGLSPKRDRVVEIAVVRIDQRGTVVDEWSTRLNPEGPVGATHIHGITQSDVDRAPLFRDVASAIAPQIQGLPIAAHNARFDLAFLRAEFVRAGWDVPWLPSYCTLDGSHHYMPHLQRRRLVDCCWEAGIRLDGAHSALGDARATAELLGHYMRGGAGLSGHSLLVAAPQEARTVAWPPGPSRPPALALPTAPTQGNPRPRRFTPARPQQPALIAQLAQLSLTEVLDEGAPVGSLTYIETLMETLEDGVITDDEASALQDLTEVYALTPKDIASAHHALLLALAHKALDDGHVSRDERQQLEAVAKALSVSDAVVPGLVAQADAARAARLGADLEALPADWALGEPLRVGDKVAFTGGDEAERARLERQAQQLGVRVMSNVSRLTAMLVADGSFAGTKLAKATELGTRIVTPADFAILLSHLQPAITNVGKAQPKARTSPTGDTVTEPAAAPTKRQVGVPPSEIRAWAAANGHQVGVRGRLPAEIIEAYELAMQQ
ncbi:exonuclease domain-containing protein [Microbacterium jiangjiandongii]|uniref:exonuclease domain-containing protein n=1 Tax=Microbacterium jiangjiandongii TaxID=3049071 RepID=UPI00214AD983|nr:histone-like nucleoid-structuring protein Lsr2 [Microbacterium sp. zg.Y843]MCR2816586.1 exonuclease domain-containing protein [Microbacterium sp. zg.Y843]